ncbi:MAG TPA: FemAB family XrtA/PEP-CTERM system-associated protein [Tepidisphaeraceae bacterium]|nr:FemAB family XrtA/PEP-CTERM system-associated protein [Tepidisphaeraceae bacterium]
MITVRELGADEEAQWECFAMASPQASFFHRLGWRRIVERHTGQHTHYRCAWRDDRLVGILPLTEIRSRIFDHALISPGFGVCAGIAAEDGEATAALAADAASLGRSLGVRYVELRHEVERPIDWIAPGPRYFVFRRDIANSAEEDMKSVPRKRRADLRKALANPALTVRHGDDFASFFHLYALSLRNLGTPILPRQFYAAIAAEFRDNVEISVVHGPDGPQAAVMSFYNGNAVLPYYGGATPGARLLHAYDLLYWSVMRRASERGARVFDFGRSRKGSSAFDYKSHWGFPAVPLRYQYHLADGALPNLGPDNPRYHLFIEAWKRLPLQLSIHAGPLISRHIG